MCMQQQILPNREQNCNHIMTITKKKSYQLPLIIQYINQVIIILINETKNYYV